MHCKHNKWLHLLDTDLKSGPCEWVSGLETGKGFPGGPIGKESAYNAGDQVRSLGQDGPLENEIATHSRILA